MYRHNAGVYHKKQMIDMAIHTSANRTAAEDQKPPNGECVRSESEVHIKKTPFHIPSLDGIRACSFLIVFLAHAGLNNYIPGYFGLSLFFFLSGYLITTYLRIEFERTGTISLKQFYMRRALRILPPFYLILFVATALAYIGVIGGTLRVGPVLKQVFHLANYQVIIDGWGVGTAAGTWVYWSLAVEEHFYLGFPLLYLWLCRQGVDARRQAIILISICSFILIWRCVLVFFLNGSHDRVYLGTDTRVDSILAGCLLAIWGNPVLDRTSISDKKLGLFWLPLGIAAILLSLLPRVHDFDQTIRYTLQSFGLTPFFIAAIRWHDRSLFRILNFAPIRYMGVLSYSLYLMHTPMLWGLSYWLPWPEWLRGVIGLVALLGIATLIYHFVERPCARLKNRLSQHLVTPTQAAKI